MTCSQSSSQDFKSVTGFIQIPYKSHEEENGGDSDDENDDEADDDTFMWLDFRDIGVVDNSVRSRIPKTTKVVIRDDKGKTHTCNGKFPLTQIYWRVSVKINRAWLRSVPKYFIRNDAENVRDKNLVTIFLSDCLSLREYCVKPEVQNAVKACFETYCRTSGAHKTISFTNLENALKGYVRQEKRQGCCLEIGNSQQFGNHQREDHSQYIMNAVVSSELGKTVLRAASHPDLVKTLSELLPYSFTSFIDKLKDGKKSSVSAPEEDNVDTELNIREGVEDKDPSATVEIADRMAKEAPWEFAFKDIIASKLKIYGAESNLNAYNRAGYLQKTPQTEKDAIYIYEILKVDAKKDGHTYMGFRKLWNYYYFKKLGYHIDGEQRWNDALDYLEQNDVIVRETVGCETLIFLRHNHQAEVDIAKGLDRLLKSHQVNPLKWHIDFQSPDFENIQKDPDQLRASHLICNLPVTVMSGRGGCGKTTVVTKLLKHICDQEEKRIEEERTVQECSQTLKDDIWEWEETHVNTVPTAEGNADTAIQTLKCLEEIKQEPQEDIQAFTEGSSIKIKEENLTDENSTERREFSDIKMEKLSQPTEASSSQRQTKSKEHILQEEVVSDLMKILEESEMNSGSELEDFRRTILLTAPTGKAARLLGCKAKLPSATLHSVIMSWRMYWKRMTAPGEAKPWIYEDVQIWVVDECSLVSIRLFATVLNILLSRANLRKVVLLGDVRQLPSIEPGDFLKDIFKTLAHACDRQFSLCIELTQNHRSESALIVQNAGRISKQELPVFDSDRRFHLVEISDQGDDNERDQAIRNLLKNAEDVKCHIESQFVSFRNAHCKAVNELCCKHYNSHSLMTSGAWGRKERLDFRIGDKICLGKNNRVQNNIKLMVQKYAADYPDFYRALTQKHDGKRKEENSLAKHECINSQENLSKSVLDQTDALALITGDEGTFEQAISDMKVHDHKVEVTKKEREKLERIKRAHQRKAEWRERQKQNGGGHAKEGGETSGKLLGSSGLGESEEKLCNGEVFFIMDEIIHFEDRMEKPITYLILSDRDPDLPRVVCVPLKVLKRDCRMKHSWVRTIHTYQGSESNTVVYILGKAIPQNWQHVYTAITRGKKSVYVVGNLGELKKAIIRRELPRNSRLSSRLKDVLMDNSDAIEFCKKDFLTSFNPDVDESGDFSFPDSDDSWLVKLEDDHRLEAVTEEEERAILKNLIIPENAKHSPTSYKLMGVDDDVEIKPTNQNASQDIANASQYPASSNNKWMGDKKNHFAQSATSSVQNQSRPKIWGCNIDTVLDSSEDEELSVAGLPWQKQNENQDNFTLIQQREKRNENSFYPSSEASDLHDNSYVQSVGIPSSQRVWKSPAKKYTEERPSANITDIHKTPTKMDDYEDVPMFTSPTSKSGPVRKLSLKSKSENVDDAAVSSESYPCTPPKVSHRDTPVDTPFRDNFTQSLTMSEDADDDNHSLSKYANTHSVRRKL